MQQCFDLATGRRTYSPAIPAIPPAKNISPTANVPSPRDYDGLAADAYPDYKLFVRMKVNLIKPLAEWLQDDSTQMWSTFRLHGSNKSESLFPVQQTFSFAVQANAGLKAKYSPGKHARWRILQRPILRRRCNRQGR